MTVIAIVLALAFLCSNATASIFVVAICKDGIVAVADSRLAFTDIESATS